MTTDIMTPERDPFRREEVEAREEERIRLQKIANALKAVLATRDGRIVLWQLLSDTGIYRQG